MGIQTTVNETVNTQAPVNKTENSSTQKVESQSANAEVSENKTGDNTSSTVPKLNLDELIDTHFPEKNSKGVDPKFVMERLPPEAKQIVASLQSDYTRKTQELARQKAELENMKQEINTQRELLTDSKFIKKITEQAQAPDPVDRWSDEGLQQLIEREAARKLQEMLAPAQEQIINDRRRAELAAFKAEHSDLGQPEVKARVRKTLEENEGMKLEVAYRIVKGELAIEREKQERQAKSENRNKSRDTLSHTNLGGKTGKLIFIQ